MGTWMEYGLHKQTMHPIFMVVGIAYTGEILRTKLKNQEKSSLIGSWELSVE